MKKQTFIEWLTSTLEHDTILDLAEHGADAGWPGLTYTSDCVELYGQFEEEIWDALVMDADDMGYENPLKMICEFQRSDMLDDVDRFKNLLVWYMAEREARRYADAIENEELEEV